MLLDEGQKLKPKSEGVTLGKATERYLGLKARKKSLGGDKRIISHLKSEFGADTLLADITAEYRFEPTPDGKGTLLKFTEISKDKAPLIVESLQKGALREQFIVQVRAANRALGLGGETKRVAAE